MFPQFPATSNPVDFASSMMDYNYDVKVDFISQELEIDSIFLLELDHLPILREKYLGSVAEVASKWNKPFTMCDIHETEISL